MEKKFLFLFILFFLEDEHSPFSVIELERNPAALGVRSLENYHGGELEPTRGHSECDRHSLLGRPGRHDLDFFGSSVTWCHSRHIQVNRGLIHIYHQVRGDAGVRLESLVLEGEELPDPASMSSASF